MVEHVNALPIPCPVGPTGKGLSTCNGAVAGSIPAPWPSVGRDDRVILLRYAPCQHTLSTGTLTATHRVELERLSSTAQKSGSDTPVSFGKLYPMLVRQGRPLVRAPCHLNGGTAGDSLLDLLPTGPTERGLSSYRFDSCPCHFRWTERFRVICQVQNRLHAYKRVNPRRPRPHPCPSETYPKGGSKA